MEKEIEREFKKINQKLTLIVSMIENRDRDLREDPTGGISYEDTLTLHAQYSAALKRIEYEEKINQKGAR